MDRIVIVTKPTRLQELVREHLTEGTARFVLESHGQSIEPYLKEDAATTAALLEIRHQIPGELPVASVSRNELPNFLFREKDLIVVCGPDGLFANVAKYVDRQLVLTVNPDPESVGGALMLFRPDEVGEIITRVEKGKHASERLPFVKATIDEETVVWGINDIFIGRKDQVSARYEVSFNGRSERQSSSGIIVATGVGSTGWIRSVAAMVEGIMRHGSSSKLASLPKPATNELVFVVREPFPSPTTGVSIVTDRVVPGKPLTVSSEMPIGGYIFSDGVIEQAVPWNAGSSVVVSVGDRYVERITR